MAHETAKPQLCEACVANVRAERSPEPSRLEHTCGREWPAYLNVYEVRQLKGGSEEGAGCYDVGVPLESIQVDSRADLDAMLKRLEARYHICNRDQWDVGRLRGRTSAAGGYDIEIRAEPEFAAYFSATRPRYE